VPEYVQAGEFYSGGIFFDQAMQAGPNNRNALRSAGRKAGSIRPIPSFPSPGALPLVLRALEAGLYVEG
jgi:hypothetical protein